MGEKEIIYLLLHCHHQNDYCIKMGSEEIHFNVSLTVRDKITSQCPQTTIFEEKGEPKRQYLLRLVFQSDAVLTELSPTHYSPVPLFSVCLSLCLNCCTCVRRHTPLYLLFVLFLPFVAYWIVCRTVLNGGISIHARSSRFNGLSRAPGYRGILFPTRQ